MSTVASLIFVGTLVLAIVSCAIYFFHYRGDEDWPSVKGVIEALVEIQCMRTNTRGRCFPVISYSYEVQGQYYSGEWNGPAFPTEEEATLFVET